MAVAYLHSSPPPSRRVAGNIALRARVAADCPELFELFSEQSFLDQALMRDPFVNAEELGRWMDNLNAERRFELVATVDGACAGFGALYLQAEHFSHCGVLVLGVRENHRRIGVGSLLLKALVSMARNVAKLGKLQLTVITDNANAVRLYRKHGFHFEGMHQRFAKRNGRYLDAYSMAILFDPPETSRPGVTVAALR